jgi:tetratricopeptide (TPR) repeat protein
MGVAGAGRWFQTCTVRPAGDVVIRTPDQRLRVFVSSTLGELAQERRAVVGAITALRLTPVLFELGARPHPPQEVYRAYLAQSDVFVGIYGERYGWIGPGMRVSGLEDEFELARRLPRLLYVKEPAPDREPRLSELLAFEVGDDAAALSARERLAPLLDTIVDPFLHAVSRLPMAWTSAILGDLDGALREVSVSLQRLRRLDEPFWTALAVATASSVEMAVGRCDDAQGHLTEVADLAQRFNNAWLAAGARAQLGILALARGRLDEARTLLDEGLDISVAINDTRGVTLCLVALARLKLVGGDPELAALLVGAAAGLRQRAALGVWPSQRRGEAELVAQIRHELDGDRFDQVYSAASKLNQREAVAAVRGQGGAGGTTS